MQLLKFFNYQFKILNYQDILEYILKNRNQKQLAAQIISLNSENLVTMKKNERFEKVVLSSFGQIVDGAGVVVAARLLTHTALTRLTGVDLMDRLLREAAKYSLRCLLIGGKGKLAENVAECYRRRVPKLIVEGTEGFGDLKVPKKPEIGRLKQIVASTRPHLVFVAFGSPAQELWIEERSELFRGSLVIGVGGAFAMLAGVLPRSPSLMRRLGLEWLFRLFCQPWRVKRQLALVEFIIMTIKFKLFNK